MKTNNGIILIKFISFIFLLLALMPIVDIEFFYIFIFIFTIIIFSKIRDKFNYFAVLSIILILILIKFLNNNLYFHEGNNILILNEKSKLFYQKNLPANMFNFLKAEFDFYDKNSKCSADNSACWRSFDPFEESKNASPYYSKYSPSMSIHFQNNKYSRKIKDLKIDNLKTAKITEINNLKYNYFWLDKFDVVRENMPFFVMIEIPKFLEGSKICWKGNIFWQKNNFNFEHLKNDHYSCSNIESKDLNKKIYAISLGQSVTNEHLNYLYGNNYINTNDKLDNFLKKNEINFQIEKKFSLIIYELFLSFANILIIFIFISLIFQFNYKIYFYTFLSTSLFLFLSFYSNQDLYYGFTVLTGGNDGLVYNSYANNMFYHLKNFNLQNFFLGAENIFYFPSSLRYFLSIFKIFFSEATYGYLTIGYTLSLIVLMIFIKIYGFKFGIFFAFLVICTRLLEGYGASIIKMLKHINESDAEPFAITIFLICLYMFILLYENKNKKNNFANFILGFLSFITISLRPNFLPTVFLLVLIHIFYLNKSHSNKQIFYTLFGLSFIFLIPLHNLYYGKELVLLSSGHIHNTGASIGTYILAFWDIINLNFNDSGNISRILMQIKRWIRPSELHYAIFFISLFFIFLSNSFYFKVISILALSQHAVLLVFEPSGRYSYLAWFLNIIVILFFIQNLVKYFYSKKYSYKKIN